MKVPRPNESNGRHQPNGMVIFHPFEALQPVVDVVVIVGDSQFAEKKTHVATKKSICQTWGSSLLLMFC